MSSTAAMTQINIILILRYFLKISYLFLHTLLAYKDFR